MAPAAPFNPPSANLPGKPFVPEWVPPPVTKETHNFAKLKSIDLSLLDSEDPTVVDELIQKVKVAIRDDGFLFLENYGVSLEQVSNGLWFGHTCTNRRSVSSFIANSLSRNIFITISRKRIRNVFYSTLTLESGPVTNIHMASR
jgi:hypothetical protein